VAGRIAQQTGKPAALISGMHGDPAKGSCRSIPGFDVHAALAACNSHLLAHGGHAAAAGFTIERRNIPAFRESFIRVWREHRENNTAALPVDYDAELPLAALTPRLMSQLERLAPFGQGNPRPVLGASGVTVHEARRMGDGSHLQMQVGQGEAVLRAVAFGQGHLVEALPSGTRADLLVCPKRNAFRGKAQTELEVVDIRPAGRAREPARPPELEGSR
jgi:single-stranded-DNA-specific exonuclease